MVLQIAAQHKSRMVFWASVMSIIRSWNFIPVNLIRDRQACNDKIPLVPLEPWIGYSEMRMRERIQVWLISERIFLLFLNEIPMNIVFMKRIVDLGWLPKKEADGQWEDSESRPSCWNAVT